MTKPCEKWMRAALTQAQKAFHAGEVPIGAILVRDNNLVAEAFNSCERDKSPLAHAEIKVMTWAAASLEDWRLVKHQLYVTLEPCGLCLGAMLQARVEKLIYGCRDNKKTKKSFFKSLNGMTEISDNNHKLIVQGSVLEEECAEILKKFFQQRRDYSPLPRTA